MSDTAVVLGILWFLLGLIGWARFNFLVESDCCRHTWRVTPKIVMMFLLTLLGFLSLPFVRFAAEEPGERWGLRLW